MAIIPHTSMNNLAEQIAEALNGVSGTRNHEELSGLLGGSDKNHYHLTSEEVKKLQDIPLEGVKGEKGDTGAAATIEIGTVTTGAAGTQAKVVNVGTPNAARLNFTIPRGDKGERGDSGDAAEGAITDHEQLSNILGGNANGHYHLTLAEREKLQKMSSGGGNKYRIVKRTFTGITSVATENKKNGYEDVNMLNKITIPEGVGVVYISGCGGGGGLLLNDFKNFTAGWNGAECINMGYEVEEGDELRIYAGRGGAGVNAVTYDTSQSTKGSNSRGEDSVVFLNGKEILRLAGGNSSEHAGNQGMDSKTIGQAAGLEGVMIHALYKTNPFPSSNLFPDLTLRDDVTTYLQRISSGVSIAQGMFSPYGDGGSLSRGVYAEYNGQPGLIIIEYVEPVGS